MLFPRATYAFFQSPERLLTTDSFYPRVSITPFNWTSRRRRVDEATIAASVVNSRLRRTKPRYLPAAQCSGV